MTIDLWALELIDKLRLRGLRTCWIKDDTEPWLWMKYTQNIQKYTVKYLILFSQFHKGGNRSKNSLKI